MLEKAKEFAKQIHLNQTYDGGSYYEKHLLPVLEEVAKYTNNENVLIAALLHDSVEDTEITLQDIEDNFGVVVRDLVYRLTDENGNNRQERKIKTYPKIAANDDAILIKLADRVVNIRSGGKLEMYRKEHSTFKQYLKKDSFSFSKIWKEIEKILNYVPGGKTLNYQANTRVVIPANFGMRD